MTNEILAANVIVFIFGMLVFWAAWKLTGWAMKWRNDPRNKK